MQQEKTSQRGSHSMNKRDHGSHSQVMSFSSDITAVSCVLDSSASPAVDLQTKRASIVG
jgi:hypothetical protein